MIGKEDIRLMALALQLALGFKSEEFPAFEDIEKERLALLELLEKGNLRNLILSMSADSIKNWLAISLIAAEMNSQMLSKMASGEKKEKIVASCALFLKKDPSSVSLFRSIIEGSDDNLFLAALLLLMSYVQEHSNEELVNELEKWLEWPDVNVRISAVKLLSNLASKIPALSEKVLNDLLEAFERDPNKRVREYIATQLGIIARENPSLKNRSYSALLSMFRKERSAKVRKAILDSLLTLS